LGSTKDKLETWAKDLKLALERELKDLDKQTKESRKWFALAKSLAEKLDIQKAIKNLEKQRTQKRRSIFDEEDRIDQKRETIIADHTPSIDPKITSRSIFQVRCRVA
jgi:adenine-specific DNA-methyltransferase